MKEPTPDAGRQPCPNCGFVHRRNDPYCPNCGQKNTASKVKFSALLREFSNSLFNIDARIIVSLRDIWKPAALTDAYFKGKHKKYIHPVRLFLFSLLFLLLAVSFTLDDFGGINTESNYFRVQQTETERKLLHMADSIYRLKSKAGTGSPALDSFYLGLLHHSGFVADSIRTIPDSLPELAHSDSTGMKVSNLKIDFHISYRDLVQLSTDEVLARYGNGSFWNDLMLEQYVKAYKAPRALLYYLIGSITWIYLLLMPAIALFMMLLYLRKKRYFVEHLIFSFHVQSVVSILFGLSLFTDYFFQLNTYIATLILAFIYYVFSLKWYYRQAWLKTFLKLILLTLVYSIALFLLFLFVLILRFLLF